MKKSYWTLSEYMSQSFPQPDPLISGLIGRSEFTLLTATAKTGKTWLSLHLAACVSSGRPFLGSIETNPSRVLIFQSEVSDHNFRERIKSAIATNPNSETIQNNLAIACDRASLDGQDGKHALTRVIMEFEPALVILDPFYTLHRKDESASKDMAPILWDLKSMALNRNAALLLVHHQGKKIEGGGSQQVGHRARGSSSFADVADNLWSLSRTKEGERLLLDIESRNYPPTNFSLIHNGQGHWSTAEGGEWSSRLSDFMLLFPEGTPLSKEECIVLALSQFKISERSVERLLAEAVSLGLLVRTSNGKKAIFTRPTTRQSLGGGESANDLNSKDWA